MVSAAVGSSGKGTVRKADILAQYNAKESDDKCGRGDIARINGQLVNEGATEACTISSEKLPQNIAERLKLSAKAEEEATAMVTVLPKKVVAEPALDVRALSATQVLSFPSIETAPVVTFTGAGAKELATGFGGAVLGSAEISQPNLPKQVVLATENGCIAVDEP